MVSYLIYLSLSYIKHVVGLAAMKWGGKVLKIVTQRNLPCIQQ